MFDCKLFAVCFNDEISLWLLLMFVSMLSARCFNDEISLLALPIWLVKLSDVCFNCEILPSASAILLVKLSIVCVNWEAIPLEPLMIFNPVTYPAVSIPPPKRTISSRIETVFLFHWSLSNVTSVNSHSFRSSYLK